MEAFQFLDNIGKGSFAKVYKVLRKADQKVFVAKEMEYGRMSEKEKQQLVNEVNILRELKHPNIIKYYDRIVDKQTQKLYIIMEYCEGGDLAQFLKKLKKDKEYLPEESVWKIFSQIVQALCEIHKRQNKILHRDIKPANIFLDKTVKLGDFGLARMLNINSEFAHTQVGTPYYMSPELIEEHKYNEKSDIWACGCLLYEMCSLQPPFQAQNYLSLAMKIKQAQYDNIPQQYTSEMKRVISWCLSVNQDQRPSVDDLLNLPRISIRLREKRLKENSLLLQQREEDLKKKQQYLIEYEQRLKELDTQRNKENVQNWQKGYKKSTDRSENSLTTDLDSDYKESTLEKLMQCRRSFQFKQ
ncbi:unnamed protein product [Paramecium octaurelia]|uniref:non-specific serine/threonine protein kinase n=1 Tax=Paramecium octaurelia TaxID=43137 RepID=A0A8S1XUQ8_PAROT|nr:unnamed protein product [Paramecium octaurelia]